MWGFNPLFKLINSNSSARISHIFTPILSQIKCNYINICISQYKIISVTLPLSIWIEEISMYIIFIFFLSKWSKIVMYFIPFFTYASELYFYKKYKWYFLLFSLKSKSRLSSNYSNRSVTGLKIWRCCLIGILIWRDNSLSFLYYLFPSLRKLSF